MRGAFHLLLLAALMTIGCGGKKGTLTIEFVVPLDVDPFATAANVRVVIGNPTVAEQTFPVSGGHFSGDVSFKPPANSTLVGPVVVEVLDAGGAVTSRGRSPDLAFLTIDETVKVWVGPVGRVAVFPGHLAGDHTAFLGAPVPGLGALFMGGVMYKNGGLAASTVVDLFQAYTLEDVAVADVPFRLGAITIPVGSASSSVGRLLLAAGDPSGSVLAFDATGATGAWTQVATDASLARDGAAGTQLADGTTLITGGEVRGGAELATATVVVTSGSISVSPVTAQMAHARQRHSVTACPVPGGEGAFVLGGATGAKPEVYLSSARTFSPLDVPVAAGIGHSATRLPSGKVLVLGGDPEDARSAMATANTFLVDAAAGTATSPAGLLSTPRSFHTATLVGTTLLVCGGYDASAKNVASCDVLDVAGEPKLTKTIPMATARSNHSAVILPQGIVIIAGGLDTSGGDPRPITSLEIYTP